MNLLVSACLLGLGCRYDGASLRDDAVVSLSARCGLIPVCPEQLGGLPTPRSPVELCGGKAVDRTGADRTREFERGAEETVKLARLFGCRCAVLKSRSPSCGCGLVYDGSFTGKLVSGNGIAAARLLREGIAVIPETELAKRGTLSFPWENSASGI